MHRAKELLRQRLFTPAIAILRYGLDDDPSYVKAELLLCRALVAAKRFDEARDALEELLQREDMLAAYTLLIRVSLVLEDGAGACEVAARAKEKYLSKELSALARDAKALLALKNGEEAVTSHDDVSYYRARLAQDTDEWSHSEIGPLPNSSSDELENRGAGLEDDYLEDPTPKVALAQVASDEYAAALLAEHTDESPAVGRDDAVAEDQDTTKDSVSAVPADVPAAERREVEEAQIIAEMPEERPSDVYSSAASDREHGLGGGFVVATPDQGSGVDATDTLDDPTPRTYGRLLGADAPDLSTAVERFAAAVAPVGRPPIQEGDPRKSLAEALDSEEVSVALPFPAAPLLTALLGDGPSRSEPRIAAVLTDDHYLTAVPTAPEGISADTNPSAAVADGHVVFEAEDGLTPPATPGALRREPVEPRLATESMFATDERLTDSVSADPEELDSQAEKATTKYRSQPSVEARSAWEADGSQPGTGDARPVATAIGRRDMRRQMRSPKRSFSKVGSWLFLSLLIFASVAGGLSLRRSRQAADILAKARQLSQGHQARNLRQALYLLRRAADRVGRKGEILSLAAGLHARLAVQFGESDLSKAQALLTESLRVGELGREDQRLAQAYLLLATSDANQVVGRLAETLDATSGPQLSLEAWAEMRRGGLEEAAARMKTQPFDGWTWPLRFQLALRQGQTTQAQDLLDRAGLAGISRAQQALARAKFQIISERRSPSVEADLVALSSENLAAAERSWVDLLLATVHQRRGSRTSALVFLSRAESGAPMLDGLFHIHRTELAFLLEDHQRAENYIQRAHWVAANDPRLQRLQVRIDLANGKLTKALDSLNAMSDTWARELYLQVLYANGDREQLGRSLKSEAAQSLAQKEIAARLALLQNQPRRALALLRDSSNRWLVVKAHFESGNTSQARALAKMASEKELLSAEGWAIQGELAFASGDFKQAERSLKAALVQAPYYLPARRLLSEIYRAGERWVDAATSSRALLQITPGSVAARRDLARALVEMRSPAAVGMLQDPSSVGANWSLLLQVRQQMLNESWLEAEKQLTLIDESWIENESLALLWQAEIYQRLGDDQAATLIYRDLLRDRAVAISAYLGLSQVYAQQGNRSAARWWATRGRRAAANTLQGERARAALATLAK